MAEADLPRLVLIVDGRVRRGVLVPCPDAVCESCHRPSTQALVSARGRVTILCDACVVSCGPPQPPKTADGREWRTLAEARAALATGDISVSAILAAAEAYEKAAAKWERATRAHGFARSTADPNKRSNVATWDPYWSPDRSKRTKPKEN